MPLVASGLCPAVLGLVSEFLSLGETLCTVKLVCSSWTVFTARSIHPSLPCLELAPNLSRVALSAVRSLTLCLQDHEQTESFEQLHNLVSLSSLTLIVNTRQSRFSFDSSLWVLIDRLDHFESLSLCSVFRRNVVFPECDVPPFDRLHIKSCYMDTNAFMHVARLPVKELVVENVIYRDRDVQWVSQNKSLRRLTWRGLSIRSALPLLTLKLEALTLTDMYNCEIAVLSDFLRDFGQDLQSLEFNQRFGTTWLEVLNRDNLISLTLHTCCKADWQVIGTCLNLRHLDISDFTESERHPIWAWLDQPPFKHLATFSLLTILGFAELAALAHKCPTVSRLVLRAREPVFAQEVFRLLPRLEILSNGRRQIGRSVTPLE